MVKTITLSAKTGDEVTLVNGGSTLVIKVANDKLIPDFVDITTEVVKANAKDIASACHALHYHHMGAETTLRQLLAEKRDELFMSIKPEQPTPKPVTTVTPEDPKKEEEQ